VVPVVCVCMHVCGCVCAYVGVCLCVWGNECIVWSGKKSKRVHQEMVKRGGIKNEKTEKGLLQIRRSAYLVSCPPAWPHSVHRWLGGSRTLCELGRTNEVGLQNMYNCYKCYVTR
jgi:hypothetical protein